MELPCSNIPILSFLPETRYNYPIMQRLNHGMLIIILTLSFFALSKPESAQAQAGTPYDLIAGVNNLRQNQGLAPYTIDNFLMGYAQSHSDYMASLGYWTHTRADGTTAFDHGIKENVAMGTDMSIQYCIYTVWSDWAHWKTMTDYENGQVGAGVTISQGIVYYTLNVLPSGSTYIEEVPSDASDNTYAQAAQEDTPIPLSPVATVTPDEDGIIIHTVQYGETLWSISQAYDVPIERILKNSGLSPATQEVFEGQRLIIQTATEPTATATASPTPDPGTATPTRPRPTFTPYPTRTPAPTGTPTMPPPLLQRALGNGKNVGIGLILVSGLGLILVIYLGFIKKS